MAGINDIDWDNLRYFLRAAQAGTLAGAARAIGVDHSTIGRRLTVLERSLGAPLFVRALDGLHLTSLGESLVPIVEEVDCAVRDLRIRAMRYPASVRLAMPTGFTKLFTGNLARLRAMDPHVTLELLTGANILQLKKGEADLAIRSGPVADEDLIVRPLGLAGWSLYASPDYLARHPLSAKFDDLQGQEIIGFDASLSAVPAAKWIEQRSAGATVALRSREMTDMLAAALTGAGLAVLPCLVADDQPGLVRVTPAVLATSPLSLVYARASRRAKPVQAVIRFVVEVMEENILRVAGTAKSGDGSSGSRQSDQEDCERVAGKQAN